MKNILIGVLIAIALFIGATKQASVGAGVYSSGNVFGTTATSGSVVITSDVRILATSSDRRFAIITPAPSCTQGAYLSFANDAPATSANSFFLAASSSYQIDQTALYTGAVHAISTSGACTLLVTGK